MLQLLRLRCCRRRPFCCSWYNCRCCRFDRYRSVAAYVFTLRTLLTMLILLPTLHLPIYLGGPGLFVELLPDGALVSFNVLVRLPGDL